MYTGYAFNLRYSSATKKYFPLTAPPKPHNISHRWEVESLKAEGEGQRDKRQSLL